MILLLVLERLTLCGCLLGLCHCSYALTANMHRGMMSCARGQYLGSEAHVLAHRLAHTHGTLALVRFLPGSSHPGLAAVQGILSLRADLHGRNVLRLSYPRSQYCSGGCAWYKIVVSLGCRGTESLPCCAWLLLEPCAVTMGLLAYAK